ncbi:MAG TPA: MATE family efflux transporter [Firmicutes bacterium]|nr:MATE family efflux transporter [Bacillota bacterium]
MDNRQLRSSIMNLSLPVMGQMLSQTFAGIITQMVVGHLGAAELAGVGLANRIMFLLIGAVSALSVGNTVLVARNIGAGDEKAAHQVLAQSLVAGVAGGAILALAGICVSRYMILFLVQGKGDPAVVEAGVLYLRIIFGSMVLGLPMFFIGGALRGAGDTKTPMFISWATNGVQILFSYPLTYGLGPLPGWGLLGACLAQGLSRAVGGLLSVWVIVNPKIGRLRLTREVKYKPDWTILKPILKIGFPAAGEQLLRQGSQLIYTMLVASMGTVAIAANGLVMTVQSLSFMPGFGFGVAATTLVGQSLGAKRSEEAAAYGWQTNRYATYFMAAMGVVFFLFAEPLAAIFTTDLEVRRLTAFCLRIVAFSQIPFSYIMVLCGALRGAGDTKWVMYITGVGQWGIRLVLSFIFGLWCGWGLPGVWLAMTVDVFVRMFFVIARFRSGKWKNIMAAAGPRPGRRQATHPAGQ